MTALALTACALPGFAAAQVADEPPFENPDGARAALDPILPTVPEPPVDADLPQPELIISAEEFREAIPPIDPADDPELAQELESIAEFEARLEAEAAGEEFVAGQTADQAAPVPALADGDAVEEIADAPVRDAALLEPLPPLEAFEVEAVEFAEEEADPEVVEVRYAVVVSGLEQADAETELGLIDRFEEFSALEQADGEAANVAQVSARLTEDSLLLERLLAAEGWYAAEVDVRLDRSTNESGQPLQAILNVVPGARYTFADIAIDAPPVQPPGLIRDNFPLQEGEPIIAERVIGAEARVGVTLAENGYPFATIGQRDILLDPETGDGVYRLPIDPGPRAVFGGFETSGDLAFGAEHIETLARFDRGDLYDTTLTADLRQAMVATGLLSTVDIEPKRTGVPVPGVEGAEYVTVAVEQQAGPPRTIAGGVGFGTGQGFRIEGSWTHRNLFPPEGALIASGVLGTREQGVGLTFRRSNAGRRDRTFQAVAEALRSDFDAFEAFTGRLAARVSYDSTPLWQKPLTYAYGLQLIGTNEQDFNLATNDLERRTFFIGGLIGQLGFDTTDSLLNPTEGFRVTALVEPEGSLQEGFTPYVRARLDGSAYYPVGDSFVIAGRARLGTIQGIDRFDLAPSRRFYGGGGGSVRGFPFQEVGPKVLEPNPNFDPEDEGESADPFRVRPIGGRSVNEAALEVRYRFGDYGIVGFVDAGQVYESTMPQFSDLRFGAGIGGRFYTNFGPFRLDVATPLDRREGEPLINVYVSIGQAF